MHLHDASRPSKLGDYANGTGQGGDNDEAVGYLVLGCTYGLPVQQGDVHEAVGNVMRETKCVARRAVVRVYQHQHKTKSLFITRDLKANMTGNQCG
jgi:hypothetical protein